MEFKAFKYVDSFEGMLKTPSDFKLVYYDPKTKVFLFYICSLIINPDGSYKIVGPDEKVKKYLDVELRKLDNKLSILEVENTEKLRIYTERDVGFFEKDFYIAFERTLNIYFGDKGYSYTGKGPSDTHIVKVNSIEDVRRLDERQAILNAERDEEMKRRIASDPDWERKRKADELRWNAEFEEFIEKKREEARIRNMKKGR